MVRMLLGNHKVSLCLENAVFKEISGLFMENVETQRRQKWLKDVEEINVSLRCVARSLRRDSEKRLEVLFSLTANQAFTRSAILKNIIHLVLCQNTCKRWINQSGPFICDVLINMVSPFKCRINHRLLWNCLHSRWLAPYFTNSNCKL